MSGWELVYYETASGTCPVRDYLDALPAAQAERVVRKLDLLERFGTKLGPPMWSTSGVTSGSYGSPGASTTGCCT